MVVLSLAPAAAHAQTTGTVVGRISEAGTGRAVPGATIEVVGFDLRVHTDSAGRFVVGSVPAGDRSVRIEQLGYKTVVVDGVVVLLGRPTQLRIDLEAAPLALEGVTVEADRRRLIEPDVSTSHDVVTSREIAALPVDRLDQVIELMPGVSGGHFRGGRIGQEVFVVDGLELKNALEASTQGFGLELSPSSLEEVEVITGGFGTTFGSALSGVVSYATKRGDPDRWRGRASLTTDRWAPDALDYGFAGLSVSGGGPVPFLGATLFMDLLAQGLADAEPHARGATCLAAADADSALAYRIRQIDDAGLADLRCTPSTRLPNQAGDRLIAFARLDRPLPARGRLTLSLLRNRLQRELYVPEYRYDDTQVGQRSEGTLVTIGTGWTRNVPGGSWNASLRGAFSRIDRYLGALDPQAFEDRPVIGGFSPSSFSFLGEGFARMPIAKQLVATTGVPGHVKPGGAAGTPYGIAAQDIFVGEGTPDMVNWSRSDFWAGEAATEYLSTRGTMLRGGGGVRMYRVESYERLASHLAGSSPNYALFFPATLSGFFDARVAGDDGLTLTAGLRLEAFRSGIDFRTDRGDYLSPGISTDWRVSAMPRLGLAMPLPGTEGRTAFRFNFGRVAQPPDFQYFLDSTLGDSLRRDVRRQGNPAISFERGRAYELGVSQLLSDNISVALTGFRKELTSIATGSLALGPEGEQRYSTDDSGTVSGAELVVRGQFPWLGFQVGYALQKATGVSSGARNDSLIVGDAQFEELPLAFDRRHSVDVSVFAGHAAGMKPSGWSAAVTSSIRSGYPFDRRAAAGLTVVAGRPARQPWTASVDARLSRDIARMPGCDGCRLRAQADGRNLLGRENVLALRHSTGTVAPSLAEVQALTAGGPFVQPIPASSADFVPALDTDRDGVISAAEYTNARFAAALGRLDPSILFGEPRQLRLGLEVSF